MTTPAEQRAAFDAAPMFTLFDLRTRGRDKTLRACGRAWAIFDVDGGCYGDDVQAELVRRGIVDEGDALTSEPQRDDEVAPASFDDHDAAIAALNAGFALIKVPDAMPGKIGDRFWRLLVLNRTVDGQFRELSPAEYRALRRRCAC